VSTFRGQPRTAHLLSSEARQYRNRDSNQNLLGMRSRHHDRRIQEMRKNPIETTVKGRIKMKNEAVIATIKPVLSS
jgi:hypothetical protein